MQLDRFEIIFSKPQTYELLSTFSECFHLMIIIYSEERKLENRKVIDLRKKNGAIFREELTRVEKWRVIILWIYLQSFAQTTEAYEDDEFKPKLEAIRSFAEKENDRIILDYGMLLKSPSLRAVDVMKSIFLSTMEIDFSSKSCGAMIYEIKMVARSFNDAYQVCSKEIKKIQNLTATPEEYRDVRVQINPTDVENDILVAQSMNLIVNIGTRLAASVVRF